MLSSPIDLSRLSARVVLATAMVTVLAVAALLGQIGSDARWLVALGHVIAVRGAIPRGLPFAATPTAGWPNPLVLAELIFSGLHAVGGDEALMLAQLVAVAVALALLARGARNEGAEPIGVAAALLVAGVGAMPSLAIARVQMFSLALFPVLLLLLRADHRAPSRRIWLVVALLALWANLHGGALLGLGVTLVYLVLDRARRTPLTAVALAVCAAASLCLTPALLHTPAYLHGVLTNAAAQQGVGEWGPLSLTAPLDVVLVLAALALLWRVWRARPPLWEGAVIIALAVLTVRADRDGVWLLMLAVAPAARQLAPARSLRILTPLLAVLAAVGLVAAVVRGPADGPSSAPLVARAVALAHGGAILADGTLDEQVAVAGGRIWAGDPIDAFRHSVQVRYLRWLAGAPGGAAAVTPAVRIALVARGSSTARLMARLGGFSVARATPTTLLYVRGGRAQTPAGVPRARASGR